MAGLRDALIAALKSLLKGKTFIEALIAFWFHPTSCQKDGQDQQQAAQTPQTQQPPPDRQQPPPQQPQEQKQPQPGDGTLRDPTAATATVTPTSTSSSSHHLQRSQTTATSPLPSPIPPCTSTTTTADFLREAERLLLQPVQDDGLRCLVDGLKAQFRDRLLNNPACMLPSYIHQLPAGTEHGRFLSLDVGGSTLRVALIELGAQDEQGTQDEQGEETERVKILDMESFKITPALKQLAGTDFFDWMAARIVEVVDRYRSSRRRPAAGDGDGAVLPMGLAWSFPIEQTSLRGGRLQSMGKGFQAADDARLVGQDLGDIIERACAARGLATALAAIVNDSAACLLAQTYARPSTRFGLILGTGVNLAVHLPVAAVGRAKFGARPPTWFAAASHVIVNTELGMFGHGLLPVTSWDARLNAAHRRPDFQPLEHMVSGMYLGEVCRYALLDAAATCGLFGVGSGGAIPPSLLTPYSLDTETLSRMEADTSASLATARAVFSEAHPPMSAQHTISVEDVRVVRTLAQYISQRSAALVAASVYALWALKADAERALAEAGGPEDAAAAAAAELAILQHHTVVSFNGSVMERYPLYRETCQGVLDRLVAGAGGAAGTIELVPAKESSLIGAAVALSCLDA